MCTPIRDSDRSPIDLHAHSSASDGLLSPRDLLKLAASRGVDVLGLTDHDTTEGIDEALSVSREVGIELIPGVELGTTVDSGELHLLGYFIDHNSEMLRTKLEEFRDARRFRAIRIIERLNEIGFPITVAQVMGHSAGGSVGRAHIARAMVEMGAVKSMDEAFDQYLGRGKPAYISRARLAPIDAIELVHSAGGVAVLAHPFTVDGLDDVLPELVSAGLDGLEAYYSLYNSEQRAQLADIARAFDLIPTGGSDFHGAGEREGRELGTVPVPPESVERLRKRRQSAH